jgi:hypothetical protein
MTVGTTNSNQILVGRFVKYAFINILSAYPYGYRAGKVPMQVSIRHLPSQFAVGVAEKGPHGSDDPPGQNHDDNNEDSG